MPSKRQKVIKRLKKRARRHLEASRANYDMDCGGFLGDVIRGSDTEGQFTAYKNCVARLRRVDPTFPIRQKGA